ncbi:MAG: HupE/UreJ family protein [Planctomycetes bacterium]|nr:HupE/UreJ family protein [Planctomycetota bacterium]
MYRSMTALTLLVLTAPVAMAHPGHGTSVAAGALHPLTGPDHLLAMLAVGLIATRTPNAAWWQVPATFLVCLVAGLGIGLVGRPFAYLEPTIAATVLALGALIAAARPQPVWMACLLVGMCALPHGAAHGQ